MDKKCVNVSAFPQAGPNLLLLLGKSNSDCFSMSTSSPCMYNASLLLDLDLDLQKCR